MYEYTPEKKQNKAKSVAVCLVVGAAVLLLSVSLIDGVAYKGIFQLISFFILGLGILFATRSMKRFTYRIAATDSDRGPDLTVTELQGRSRITVCRIAIEGISETVVCDRAELKRQKARIRSERRKFYSYTADILEERTIVVHATECGEEVSVILSYDETLFSFVAKQ